MCPNRHAHFLCSLIPRFISGKETQFAQTYRIGAIRLQSPAAAFRCTPPGQETVVDLISPSHFFPPTSPTPVLLSRMRSGPAAVVLSGAFCLDVGWLLYLRRPTYHLPRKAFCQPPKSRGRCHRRRRDGSAKPLPIGKRPPASDQFHFPENISKSSVRAPRTLPPAG